MIEAKEFETIRKDLIRNDVITKRITLDSIDISEDDIKNEMITVYGSKVSVNKSFFRKLAMVINVNSTLASQFIKNDDIKIYTMLINAIKKYKTIKKDAEKDVFTLIADPVSKCIVDIVKSKGGRMSMNSICDVTERILDEHSYMQLESVDSGYGNVNFNFLNQKEVYFPKAGPDEAFKFGFSINATPTTTSIGLYNHRMVCTNGMTVNLGNGELSNENKFSEKFSIRSLDTESLQKFFNKLKSVKETGFQPSSFNDQLNAAINTKASLAEVHTALTNCYDAVDPKGMNTQDLNHCYSKIAKKYFPAYGLTINRVDKKGFDTKLMNDKQKTYIKTGMSVWDVINSVTFLGSNDSEFNFYDSNKAGLKSIGGRLFAKSQKGGYDLQFSDFSNL